MKKIFLVAAMLIFGMVGSASADLNLISNGDFNAGLTNWATPDGHVTIADANTSSLGGLLASAEGMVGNYALLGLDTSEGISTLRQDFTVENTNAITVSFNWAFDYWDNSFTAADTFLAFVRQDGTPALRITMLDLQTNGTFFNPDAGLAYGRFEQTYDISAYTTDDARLIFRLIEEADSWCLSGTASVAGIDNVSVKPVPEPATMLLMGLGVAGLVGIQRRRFGKKA